MIARLNGKCFFLVLPLRVCETVMVKIVQGAIDWHLAVTSHSLPRWNKKGQCWFLWKYSHNAWRRKNQPNIRINSHWK